MPTPKTPRRSKAATAAISPKSPREGQSDQGVAVGGLARDIAGNMSGELAGDVITLSSESQSNMSNLSTSNGVGSEPVTHSARERMIAEAAYYRAERRGFEPGHELEDWLAAEAEITDHSLERSRGRLA